MRITIKIAATIISSILIAIIIYRLFIYAIEEQEKNYYETIIFCSVEWIVIQGVTILAIWFSELFKVK